MKYIVFESPSGLEIPILFPDHLSHHHVADLVRPSRSKPISAGFLSLDSSSSEENNNIDIIIFGESVSLYLRTRDVDSDLIKRAFHKD